MSVTEYFSSALSQTASGFCFAYNPVWIKFENTIAKTPDELADDFGEVYRQAQLDINVFTVCIKDKLLPKYLSDFMTEFANEAQSRLRIFTFINGDMFLINKTIESRTNEPIKCTLERMKDGTLAVTGADEYIEDNYELVELINFEVLKQSPQGLLFDFSANGRFIRYYVVLMPDTVVSLSDLKSIDTRDIQEAFKLNENYLFVLPFLQSAGFFKEIIFCSFYDDMQKAKLKADPLVQLLTQPCLFARISFGLKNALNSLLFDAFYIRKAYVISFACDEYLKQGDSDGKQVVIKQSDELQATATLLQQICVGVARGSCILCSKNVNSDNIALARSRFLYESVQRRVQQLNAGDVQTDEERILEFQNPSKARTRQFSAIGGTGSRTASALRQPLQQLGQLDEVSFDEEVTALMAELDGLRHAEVEERGLVQSAESDLRRLEDQNTLSDIQKELSSQAQITQVLEALRQEIAQSRYINAELVQDIAALDQKIDAARQIPQQRVAAEDERVQLEIERRKQQVDAELREEYAQRLARLKNELRASK